MDFSRGYTSAFRVVGLDSSWSETGPIGSVTSISITRDASSEAPLLDSADLDLDAPATEEGYVRVYMDATQDSSTTSFPLGTFLLESSGGESGAGSEWSTAELWSVLKPADERILPVGWYAHKGTVAANKAASLLRACIDAPVEVDDGSPSLADHYVSDGSKTYLAAAWELLPEGWTIATDGYGNVRVMETEHIPFTVHESEIIGTVKESWDLAGIPNSITVTDDAGNEYTAVNDDRNSPTSTVARGRVIDGDGSGARNSGESLRSFARRLLSEQSKVTRTCTYDREFRSDVKVGDMVTVPGKEGAWRVTGQSLTCGCGVTVSETVVREEATWR